MRSFYLNFIVMLPLVFFIHKNGYGQDCSELKEKNEKLEAEILEKNAQLKKNQDDIGYYQQTLSLLNSKIEAESQDVVFKINSIEGNKDQGSIEIQGLVENKGMVSRFQIRKISIIDPQGNVYVSRNWRIGSERSAVASFQKNIPLKISFGFDSVAEEFPVAKALVVEFYNRNGFADKDPNFMFRNLNISWK